MKKTTELEIIQKHQYSKTWVSYAVLFATIALRDLWNYLRLNDKLK